MNYQDRVYGKFGIDEPVIVELINSPALQRLKRINQFGYGPFWASKFKVKDYDHNRFSHSVGTCLLLRKYGAPIEEQIAGLVHDVSHTAFSHCTEHVLNIGNEEKQTYQDSMLDGYVRKSEIPGILEKHGFDLEYILDDKNFPLKEKSLPDLCADRIDYTIRDAIVFSELDAAGAGYFLDNLSVRDNVWFFETFESAKRYRDFFSRMNDIFYAGFVSGEMFCATADFIKYALEKKYIAEDDLRIDDDFVVDKARKYFDSDERLKLLFDRMDDKVVARNDKEEYDAQSVCKSRVVDPWFLDGGRLRRVSEADLGWKEKMVEEMKPRRYFVKFER